MGPSQLKPSSEVKWRPTVWLKNRMSRQLVEEGYSKDVIAAVDAAAAGFSFFQKLAISVGVVITGYILKDELLARLAQARKDVEEAEGDTLVDWSPDAIEGGGQRRDAAMAVRPAAEEGEDLGPLGRGKGAHLYQPDLEDRLQAHAMLRMAERQITGLSSAICCFSVCVEAIAESLELSFR